MSENINFIPANELPEAEGDEVSVLCVENGELKQKSASGLGSSGGGVSLAGIIKVTEDWKNTTGSTPIMSYDTIDFDFAFVKEQILSAKPVEILMQHHIINSDNDSWGCYVTSNVTYYATDGEDSSIDIIFQLSDDMRLIFINPDGSIG